MNKPSNTPQRLREAAETCRTESAELARHPAPDLTVEYPDLDGAVEHVEAGREMKIRYGLAEVFDEWARMGELDPDLLNRVGGPETVALADAVLGAPAAPGGAR